MEGVEGALTTEVDPGDRRRTLVRLAPRLTERAQRAAVPVDTALAAALDSSDPEAVEEVISSLDSLAAHLLPAALGRLQPQIPQMS